MTQPAPNGWRVLSQAYGEALMPDGSFQQVARVTIRADDGSTTTLEIPIAQYTPENVIAQGNYWYDQHAAVRAIGN